MQRRMSQAAAPGRRLSIATITGGGGVGGNLNRDNVAEQRKAAVERRRSMAGGRQQAARRASTVVVVHEKGDAATTDEGAMQLPPSNAGTYSAVVRVDRVSVRDADACAFFERRDAMAYHSCVAPNWYKLELPKSPRQDKFHLGDEVKRMRPRFRGLRRLDRGARKRRGELFAQLDQTADLVYALKTEMLELLEKRGRNAKRRLDLMDELDKWRGRDQHTAEALLPVAAVEQKLAGRIAIRRLLEELAASLDARNFEAVEAVEAGTPGSPGGRRALVASGARHLDEELQETHDLAPRLGPTRSQLARAVAAPEIWRSRLDEDGHPDDDRPSTPGSPRPGTAQSGTTATTSESANEHSGPSRDDRAAAAELLEFWDALNDVEAALELQRAQPATTQKQSFIGSLFGSRPSTPSSRPTSPVAGPAPAPAAHGLTLDVSPSPSRPPSSRATTPGGTKKTVTIQSPEGSAPPRVVTTPGGFRVDTSLDPSAGSATALERPAAGGERARLSIHNPPPRGELGRGAGPPHEPSHKRMLQRERSGHGVRERHVHTPESADSRPTTPKTPGTPKGREKRRLDAERAEAERLAAEEAARKKKKGFFGGMFGSSKPKAEAAAPAAAPALDFSDDGRSDDERPRSPSKRRVSVAPVVQAPPPAAPVPEARDKVRRKSVAYEGFASPETSSIPAEAARAAAKRIPEARLKRNVRAKLIDAVEDFARLGLVPIEVFADAKRELWGQLGRFIPLLERCEYAEDLMWELRAEKKVKLERKKSTMIAAERRKSLGGPQNLKEELNEAKRRETKARKDLRAERSGQATVVGADGTKRELAHDDEYMNSSAVHGAGTRVKLDMLEPLLRAQLREAYVLRTTLRAEVAAVTQFTMERAAVHGQRVARGRLCRGFGKDVDFKARRMQMVKTQGFLGCVAATVAIQAVARGIDGRGRAGNRKWWLRYDSAVRIQALARAVAARAVAFEIRANNTRMALMNAILLMQSRVRGWKGRARAQTRAKHLATTASRARETWAATTVAAFARSVFARRAALRRTVELDVNQRLLRLAHRYLKSGDLWSFVAAVDADYKRFEADERANADREDAWAKTFVDKVLKTRDADHAEAWAKFINATRSPYFPKPDNDVDLVPGPRLRLLLDGVGADGVTPEMEASAAAAAAPKEAGRRRRALIAGAYEDPRDKSSAPHGPGLHQSSSATVVTSTPSLQRQGSSLQRQPSSPSVQRQGSTPSLQHQGSSPSLQRQGSSPSLQRQGSSLSASPKRRESALQAALERSATSARTLEPKKSAVASWKPARQPESLMGRLGVAARNLRESRARVVAAGEDGERAAIDDDSTPAGLSALTDVPGGLDDTLPRLLRAAALRTYVPRAFRGGTTAREAFATYRAMPPSLVKSKHEVDAHRAVARWITALQVAGFRTIRSLLPPRRARETILSLEDWVRRNVEGDDEHRPEEAVDEAMLNSQLAARPLGDNVRDLLNDLHKVSRADLATLAGLGKNKTAAKWRALERGEMTAAQAVDAARRKAIKRLRAYREPEPDDDDGDAARDDEPPDAPEASIAGSDFLESESTLYTPRGQAEERALLEDRRTTPLDYAIAAEAEAIRSPAKDARAAANIPPLVPEDRPEVPSPRGAPAALSARSAKAAVRLEDDVERKVWDDIKAAGGLGAKVGVFLARAAFLCVGDFEGGPEGGAAFTNFIRRLSAAEDDDEERSIMRERAARAGAASKKVVANLDVVGAVGLSKDLAYVNLRESGQQKRATFPTSKAHISAVFHSFRLTFGRLSERFRSVDAFSGTRARGTLTLKRR